MDEKKYETLDLEEIIKEFGGTPRTQVPEPEPVPEQEEPVAEEITEEEEEQWEELPWQMPAPQTEPEPTAEQELEATRRIDVLETVKTEDMGGDTVRLEGLRGELAERAPIQETAEDTEEEAKVWKPEDTIHAEPFSDQWEPEYDQPMGEYIPPQPIQFQPRSRLRELKKKLIAGPEKRYYALTEQGVGKLQAAIFLSLLVVLIAAASTLMYALGMVQENRMRLMVFGQFFAMLISALLGYNQLIEGAASLLRKKFTLNTLLGVTFLVCCVDGILCLNQLRVPCCAAFSLEVTMSLWATYQKRAHEISQMDTMRRASRLDGLVAVEDYLDEKRGFLRKEGQVEDFMDRYADPVRPEETLQKYSFVAMFIAFAIGVFAGVMNGLSLGVMGGISAGVQVAAVSLLASVPATAFISHTRPISLLQRRLHRLGTVLCGWQGVEGLSGKVIFPINFGDMYPADALRLNGVKYFGSREPEQIASYAAAVVIADRSGLTELFAQVLESYNGRFYDAYNLEHFENGGMSGVVEGETVLLGSASFMKENGVEVPENVRMGYAVYVAIEKELCGLFAVSYEKTQSATAGISTLTSYKGLQCVMTGDDFMITYGFMKNKFGIKPKRFILPDYPLRNALRQVQIPEDGTCLMMTTATGLAPIAYGVTGARVLRNACRLGTVLHIIGGAVGLAMMILLVILGALDLLTPANMFLYQLVWMIPAFLVTEWTRSI